MQSLCTLRSHCRQWLRNTRYQADATPYLDRTFTGWIAPACGWRTLFDDLVGELYERLTKREAEGLCRLEIDDEFKLDWCLHWQIARRFSFENAINI